MADFGEEAVKMGLDVIDKIILEVTPDAIIDKTTNLVDMAFDKDMTGAEKFEWVLEQVKPLMGWLIRELGERLVQLIYEIAIESRAK